MPNSETPTTLERLVYTSRATEPLGTVDLFNILNHARHNNARLGITGHLLYADGVFTQCIEGTPAAIESLWQSLMKDARHEVIRVQERSPITQRRFAEWSMAFSSYRYLNAFNMPGFFPLDANGQSEKSVLLPTQP
ncbi:BLUF domain-containing protein [Limnohabitans sp.]|uniref:BLUF domain-containing protein n=1 Tax=Limnohabitans sp. TaxID=1907725 RepID=UPI0038BCCEA0